MKKSGKMFRVGIFLDFVRLTTRTMHPHGAYVRRARRNRIDPHGGEIERLVACTRIPGIAIGMSLVREAMNWRAPRCPCRAAMAMNFVILGLLRGIPCKLPEAYIIPSWCCASMYLDTKKSGSINISGRYFS